MESSQENNQPPSPRRLNIPPRQDNAGRGVMEQINLFNNRFVRDVLSDMERRQSDSEETDQTNETDNNDTSENNNNAENTDDEALNRNENSVMNDNTRSLLSALRSSQSFAPLIVLVLLKLLHEYALPIFFFLLLILLRTKLDRHVVEQLKHRVDMNIFVLVLVVLAAASVTWVAYVIDYEHTGCYLVFQPPSYMKSTSSSTVDPENEEKGNTQLEDNADLASEEFNHQTRIASQNIYHDESRLLWVFATAFRVDLVAQCMCIGLKALFIIGSQLSFNIASSWSTNHQRDRRNLFMLCWNKLVTHYIVISMKIDKFIQDQSRMSTRSSRNPTASVSGGGGVYVQDDMELDDTASLLASYSKDESENTRHEKDDALLRGAAAEEASSSSISNKLKEEEEEDGVSRRNAAANLNSGSSASGVGAGRSSSGFAHHRMLKRKLCLIESIMLAYRCFLPTLIWCRYYATMRSWADTIDLAGKYASHAPNVKYFLQSWVSWLVTGEVLNDGTITQDMLTSSSETNQDTTSTASLRGGLQSGEDPSPSLSTTTTIDGATSSNSLADTMAKNSISSSGLLFIIFYVSIKAIIFGYYVRNIGNVFKALYPPSMCTISACSANSTHLCMPASSTSASSSSTTLPRTHFSSFSSRIWFYCNQIFSCLKRCLCCLCCCFGGYGSHSLLAPSYGFGRMASEADVAEAGNPECPICFDTLEKPIRLNPCGHLFCEDCVCEWLDMETSCPMCRATVAMDEQAHQNLFKSLNMPTGATTFSFFVM